MIVLGIDIGGSGIKGALVCTETGELKTERHKILTPQPATPEAVADTVIRIIDYFKWDGPVGCGFPAVVRSNIVCTATNIHFSWIGTNIKELFKGRIKNSIYFLNDADAAGIAEIEFGAGKGVAGTVVMVTVGTGVGTAVFANSELVTNTELGHILLKGRIAEKYISDKVRKRKKLSWKKWGKRFDVYLQRMNFLFSPTLFIVSGGISNKWDKFEKYLEVKSKVVPAKSLNFAGIIGSSVFAAKQERNA